MNNIIFIYYLTSCSKSPFCNKKRFSNLRNHLCVCCIVWVWVCTASKLTFLTRRHRRRRRGRWWIGSVTPPIIVIVVVVVVVALTAITTTIIGIRIVRRTHGIHTYRIHWSGGRWFGWSPIHCCLDPLTRTYRGLRAPLSKTWFRRSGESPAMFPRHQAHCSRTSAFLNKSKLTRWGTALYVATSLVLSVEATLVTSCFINTCLAFLVGA